MDRRTLSHDSGGIKYEAAARDAGLRLLQFRDIHPLDVTAAHFERAPRTGIGSAVENRVVDAQCIRRERFAGVDRDAFEAAKLFRIDPGWIQEQSVLADRRHGGLEMQAILKLYRNRIELLHGRHVGAVRKSNVHLLIENQHIAAIERGGRLDAMQRPIALQHHGHALGFSTAGRRAGAGDDRYIIRYYRCIFDEDPIRQLGYIRHMHDGAAVRVQKPLVDVMLCSRARGIDRLARQKRQLALRDPGAQGACDRQPHARYYSRMACDHTDPPVVMQRAEAWLRERGVPPEKWGGLRIRHSENTPSAKGWKSVVIEIERRDGQWIVTDIDRRPEVLRDLGLSLVC